MRRRIPELIVAGIVAVFLADMFTPRGMAVWLFYLVPLIGTFWWQRRYVERGVAASCLLLNVIGYIGLPNQTSPRFAIVNRIIDSSVLVLTAALIERLKRLNEQRRANELALVERERHLRAILDSEPECVKSLAADGTLLEMNRAGLEMIEAERADQVLGHCIYPLVVPEHRRAFQALTERVFQGQAGSLEFETVGLKGGHRWLETHATPLRDESGRIVSLLSVTRDITERKQVEHSLREREQQLRLFVEHSPAAIAMLDRDLRYLVASHRWLADYRLSDESVVGHSHYDLFPEIPERWKEIHRRCLAGAIEKCEEDPFPREDGTIDWVRWEIRPWHTPDGDVGGLIIFSEVINERKQAESRLIESEQRLALARDSAHIGIWDWDVVANKLVWDANMYELYGIQPQDFGVAYEAWEAGIHPEDRDRAAAETEAALHGSRGDYHTEFRVVWPNGEVRHLEAFGVVQRAANGAALRMLGTNWDITERTRAEAALRESEQRFSTLYRVLPIGTCISRFADGVFLDVNEAFAKITGHTREELLGRSSLEVTYWITPEDRAKLVQSLAENGFVRDWEVGLRRKDGSIGHSLRSLERLTLDGQDCILTVLSDITDRKRMEQELQDSAANLAAAQERAKMGSWELDLATQTGWWSHGMFRLFDRDMALGPPTFPEFLELVHQDDRQSMLDTQRKSFEDGQDGTGEFRLNPLHGAPRHFSYSIHCLRDERGDTVRLAGTLQDITERKRTDDELVQSRERLEILSRQLISTQESERRHLSRELHDEIGQELTSIKLNLRNLQQVSPGGADLVSDTLVIAEHALQQVRSLALDLRPSMLDDIGLAAALRWCLDRQANRAGFAPHFIAEPSEIAISPEVAITCFRVAQECLTNIARHAHARNVRLELRQYESALDLHVQDDGQGFDVNAATERATHGASLGLISMRERAELVGGLIDIESSPAGTTIHARFPSTRPE